MLLVYKLLHLAGVMMVFLGFGGLIVRGMLDQHNTGLRKLGAITSGIGLLLLLVSGFGMVARYGFNYTDLWLIIKYGIWLALGCATVLVNRRPEIGIGMWWGVLVLGIVAAVVGVYKV